MKYYHCLVSSKTELSEQLSVEIPPFQNGKLLDKVLTEQIEDYITLPIVSIHETTKNSDTLLIIAADGYIQKNPLTNKRSVVLRGNYDSLKNVLEDIYEERNKENPVEIFDSYIFQTTAADRTRLRQWTKNEYKRP